MTAACTAQLSSRSLSHATGGLACEHPRGRDRRPIEKEENDILLQAAVHTSCVAVTLVKARHVAKPRQFRGG